MWVHSWCGVFVVVISLASAEGRDLCLGEAPPIDHGIAVINGYVIYYICETGYVKLRGGSVECANGTWIGSAPTCVDVRCHTRDLNGTGLDLGVEYVKHSKEYPVSCAKGYRASDERKYVRCIRGRWKIPMNSCTEESCSDEPPPIEHGRVRTFSQVPGSQVSYECDPPFQMSGLATVLCRLGKWTGEPPSCLYPRCHTRDLNGTGLDLGVEYVEDSKEHPVSCAKGYRASDERKYVRCTRGKWKIPMNSCTEESCSGEPTQIEHGRVRTFSQLPGSEVSYDCDPPFEMSGLKTVRCRLGEWAGETPSCLDPNSDESSSIHPENCVCSYEHIDTTLIAKVRGNRLLYRDLLKNGDAALLSCIDRTRYQLWPNGLVTSGQTMLTCSRCLRWQETDLPTCINLHPRASWISWHDQLKLLPGGAIKVRPGETIMITCHNLNVAYPAWSVTNGVLERVHYTSSPFGEYTRLDSSLILSGEHPNLDGIYTCSAADSYGNSNRSSILDLRFTVDQIRCPVLDRKGIFSISYSNGQQVRSVARYSCKEDAQAISGLETRECLENGDWSDTEPKCITGEILCPELDNKSIFTIRYRNGRHVGSVARYLCKEDFQAISGLKTRTCLGTGNWSEPEPRCISVRGCHFNVEDITSQLVFDPVKEFYRFGEVVGLLCPFGLRLTTDVENVTCTNSGWSSPIPDCH